MKKLILIPIITAAAFTSCASFQNANQAADYNHDGYVSDAESYQFHKQKNVENANVNSERMKRENAVDTVHDLNYGVQSLHGIRNGLRAF